MVLSGVCEREGGAGGVNRNKVCYVSLCVCVRINVRVCVCVCILHGLRGTVRRLVTGKTTMENKIITKTL